MKYGTKIPLRLALFTEDAILVAGADNIRLIWRNSQWLTAKAGHMIGLVTILDTPRDLTNSTEPMSRALGKHHCRTVMCL